MTARLATHPHVASRTRGVIERLAAAEIDVEAISATDDGGVGFDALEGVRNGTLDLALVGIGALRGSAADDLTTVAVLPREEYRDVLVDLRGHRAGMTSLPAGSRVGVHGARRMAFLRAHRPDVEAVDLPSPRGGPPSAWVMELDALVLGAIEARQFGLAEDIVEALDPKAWLPEPGQGALALVARHPIAEATAIDHLPTRTALRTELALLDALDAGPDAPLGSLAQPSGRWIRLWAVAASTDGSRIVRSDLTGPLDEPEALGAAVARQLVSRGVEIVLASPLV